MKTIIKAIIIIVTLILELIISNLLDINSIKPDLMLIVIICLSFNFGAQEGTVLGFTGGLLKDVFSVNLLGINALAKTLIGYFSGVIREKIFYQHMMWIVTIFTFGFTFINNIIVYFIMNALQTNYDFAIILKNTLLTQAIINSILAPLIFLSIKKVFKYIQDWS